jgi:hypothetical protein
MQAWRAYAGFSHDLAEATGKRIYEVRATLHERIGSDFLRGRILALKRGTLPHGTKPLKQAVEIIAAIRTSQQPKPGPIFKDLQDCNEEEIEAILNPEPSQYQLDREAARHRGASYD